MKPKYPSLCATVEPATSADGKHGAIVRCTASGHPIGFIWWATDGASIHWRFRRDDDDPRTDTRNTERNAVQALRDLANGAPCYPLLDLAEQRTQREAERPTPSALFEPWRRHRPTVALVVPVVAAPPPPARRIQWDDAAPAFDVTAAIAASFKR